MKYVHAELMMLYAQDAMETDKPTKEAAAKHAMAMCGIDPATYKDES